MADEEFGVGLENAAPTNTDVIQAVVDNSSPTLAATTQAAAPDEFLTQFRSMIDGVPENLTRDDLVDHLIDIQTKASRAAELERQNAEFQAQLAAAATKTATPEAKPEVVADEVDDYKLPWEVVKIDPSSRAMVTQDPSGGYIPKNPASPLHIAAATEMNRRAMYEARFVEDLLDDPEGAVAKLTTRELTKLRKEYDAKLAAFEAKFQPIEQQATASQAEREHQTWIDANAAKLFAQDGKLTPVGSQVDLLLKSGKFNHEEALAFAEKMNPAPAATTSNTAATTTPNHKPATKPVFAKPNRLVDDITARQRKASQPPADRRVFEGGSGKWKVDFKDIDEKVTAMFGD